MHKVFERLEEQKQKIAEQELKNIKELKADEVAASSLKELTDSGPLFNIPSEEFENFPVMSPNTLDRALAEFI